MPAELVLLCFTNKSGKSQQGYLRVDSYSCSKREGPRECELDYYPRLSVRDFSRFVKLISLNGEVRCPSRYRRINVPNPTTGSLTPAENYSPTVPFGKKGDYSYIETLLQRTVRADYSDWKTGNQRIIKRWPRLLCASFARR